MTPPPTLSRCLLAAALLTGCTHGMKLKLDGAWERIDPMGHRRIHQERESPRNYRTGVRLPEDDTPYPLPGSGR